MTPPSVTPGGVVSQAEAWHASTSSPPSTGASTPAGSPSPTSGTKPTDSPSWRMEVEIGRIFGANQAPRHKVTAWRISEVWRDATYRLARHHRIPRLGHARIEVTVHLHAGRKADQQNYLSGPSVKGLLDGLVRAGIVTDDREPYCHVTCETRSLEGGRPRVVLHITPKELAS